MNQATDETPELLYQGEWLRMVKRGQWESCERTHGKDGLAVLVIAVTPDDHVLFVEQYRVPLGAKTIEMPAGLVGDDDASDTLESAARSELIEETGWDAARIDVLLVGPPTAGTTNERIPFRRPRHLTRVAACRDPADGNIPVHNTTPPPAPPTH